MNSYYLDYYRRAIDQHPHGLKMVLGGTGLGKTSSLAVLLGEGNLPSNIKFIYVANRIQLLDEMAGQVKKYGVPFVHQRRDEDHLRQAVNDELVEKFLAHPATPALVDEYNRRSGAFGIRLDALVDRATKFKRLARFSEEELADIPGQDDLVRDLLSPLKRLRTLAAKLQDQAPAPGQQATQQQAKLLAQLPLWSALFPYLRFQQDDSQRLLLLTVQKAFYGVFNGQSTIRLGRWEAAPAGCRYVFIFDEFDFLENDLLTMLSNDKEVQNPFGLVQTFYERINAQKLSHSDYLNDKPSWQAIRKELTDICDRVGKLKTDHGIDFPTITHFVTQEDEIRGKAIFQSNYSLVTQPIYLRDPSSRANSFDLTIKQKSAKRAFVLLDIVSRAVKDIVRLFNRLRTEHEDIYPELLRQCFDGTNYLREIGQVNQIGWKHEWAETNYGYLLANGFGLYEIETNRSQLTDPAEVAISYLSMNNSPEAIIREMSQEHLLFGLSATAHIHRTLRHFDWVGLAHPLTPDDSFQPLPTTPEDQADIKQAGQEKSKIRANEVRFEIAEPLALASSFGQQLEAIANHHEKVFGTGEARNFRLKRVRHFFGVLAWLAQQPANTPPEEQTHLIFLASVKQLSFLLGTVKSDEETWFKATAKSLPEALSSLQLYDLRYRDEATGQHIDCYVVLYDAKFGQALRKDPALEKQYDALFWDGKPVLVATTYPSAGNGVNLQYYVTPEAYEARGTAGKRDFIYLHLLDAQYFYFSRPDPDAPKADNQAAIKRDVYAIMKLLHAKLISEAQAISQLNNIRRINSFNKPYLGMADGVLNQLSVFIQAIGRIERVWQPMPHQLIRMDRDVFKVFDRFLADKSLSVERKRYLAFASANMESLLKAIDTYAERHRDDLLDLAVEIKDDNQRAQDAIHELVLDIERFKQTGHPANMRERWQKLREDVLKHNMQADSLSDIRGVFQTNYVADGQVHINRKLQVVPATAHSHEFEPWSLNAVYRPLTVIRDTPLTNYFRRRGYELAFSNSGTYFLPYVYQSILTGAIGEEAVQAILAMKQILASGDTIPDELFEVADLRVEERPIFIDCKNYGTQTIQHFTLPANDPLYHPNLNEAHFKQRMADKWQTINRVLGNESQEPCRLIVMNLVHDEESALHYHNPGFERVNTWEEARIIVLTGALKRHPTDAHDLLTDACLKLLKYL
jgi:hypothetical protein